MLIDANILLYAVDETSPFHDRAPHWLEDALNGSRRVGLPWASLTAFLRIVTNPRALPEPLAPAAAWALVDAWLDAIDRQEQRQLANLLTVIATGSQGPGEAIRKAIQSLTEPCSKSP